MLRVYKEHGREWNTLVQCYLSLDIQMIKLPESKLGEGLLAAIRAGQ